MKKCKCDPALEQECDVCNPPLSKTQQEILPVRVESMCRKDATAEALKRLVALADTRARVAAAGGRGNRFKGLSVDDLVQFLDQYADRRIRDGKTAHVGWKTAARKSLGFGDDVALGRWLASVGWDDEAVRRHLMSKSTSR